MPINLSRIGHAAVRVRDIERAKKFYIEVLGFVIEEEDPEHGGVFMSLGRDDTHEGHVFDLSPVEDPDNALEAPERNQVGVAHIAIKVDTHQDMKDAYDHLISSGVTVDRLVEQRHRAVPPGQADALEDRLDTQPLRDLPGEDIAADLRHHPVDVAGGQTGVVERRLRRVEGEAQVGAARHAPLLGVADPGDTCPLRHAALPSKLRPILSKTLPQANAEVLPLLPPGED